MGAVVRVSPSPPEESPMYLAYTIRRVNHRRLERNWHNFSVLIFRVVIDKASGRATWRLHESHPGFSSEGSARITYKRARFPFFKSLEMGKRVSVSEASRLVGLVGPPALDYLTEQVMEGDNGDLQNYQKPPKPRPKKEPPSPEEVAAAKRDRAAEKVREFDTKLKRLTTLRKKWAKRVRYYQKKIDGGA